MQKKAAGSEKKPTGSEIKHGGLCDETPQAPEAGTLPVMSESLPVSRCACVVSPKAYPSPGAVSYTATMCRSISSTELITTPDLFPSSFDVPERSANGASSNPDKPGRSFL